ncbi:hypothetical protein GOEFS_062_00130 [Gordonia effusa NBRC 100432]|uniref:AAA+ ATPase domain-containing protein n=1 Tax=Gordonia effusa NBRC 100432 TaxID=1077974 RepID=H0R0V3_9ACTN|nr:AAA family ATPase [Gordonia effusa]GAB18704.1 hypothetical protein GOEFS_062_00130 [Gordonia effusa NBRC 100432]
MNTDRDESRYVMGMRIARDSPRDRYPFNLPAVAHVARPGGLAFPAGVTFLVGENGSGKSTLIEALAVAAGLNPEGGSQHNRFTTRSTESELGRSVDLVWGPFKPRSRFFLRAESFYNFATETESLGDLSVFDGVSPHERSHGESFVDLIRQRFFPRGFYVMDEPEAALSPRGCLAVMAMLAELVDEQCQIIIATHSPILLALPGATILEISDDGQIEEVAYDDVTPVRITRDFLTEPERYLRHLFTAD